MTKAVLFKNYFLRFGTVLVERLSGLVLAPLLIANIGLDGYGLYGLASGLMLVFMNVLSLRLPMAMIRFYPDQRDVAGNILVAGLIFWAALALLSAFVFTQAPDQLARWTFGDETRHMLFGLFMAAALMLVLYEFVSFTFRAESRFGLLSILDASERIAIVCACAVLLLSGNGTIEAIAALVLIGATVKVGVIVVPALRGLRPAYPDRVLLKKMFAFCLPFLPHLAGVWVIERGAFYLLAKDGNSQALGFFTLAFTLAAILLAVTAPLQTTLYPLLRKAYDDMDYDSVRELINTSLRFAITISGFGIISLVFGTEHLLAAVGISDARPSTLLILLLSLTFMVGSVRQVVINVLHISHNTSALIWISPLGAMVSVLSGLLLIGKIGPSGAAIAILVGTLAQTAAMYTVSPAFCIQLPNLQFFRGLLAATVLAGAIQFATGLIGGWHYWAGLSVTGLLYLFVMHRYGGLTKSERQKIFEYILRPYSQLAKRTIYED